LTRSSSGKAQTKWHGKKSAGFGSSDGSGSSEASSVSSDIESECLVDEIASECAGSVAKCRSLDQIANQYDDLKLKLKGREIHFWLSNLLGRFCF
jgi:hypothetical protein